MSARFAVMTLVSVAAFYGMPRLVFTRRPRRSSLPAMADVAAVVLVGRMGFAKLEDNAGWPPGPSLGELLGGGGWSSESV